MAERRVSANGKTAYDIARSITTNIRREFIGRRDITDEDWIEAIERAICGLVEPDDRYGDGYDDGYDAGYEDAEQEENRNRERLRGKKRAEKQAEKAKRGVILVAGK